MPADILQEHIVSFDCARGGESDDPAEPDRKKHESADESAEYAPAPFAPDGDDGSALGDTDQHSDA